MKTTKRHPVSVGEMLTTESLQPLNLEINKLADAMGVHRNNARPLKTICNNPRTTDNKALL